MKTLYYRLYQKSFRLISPLLPWRKPELLEGANSVLELPNLLKDRGIKNVLIVTDQGIVTLGIMEGLLEGLTERGVEFSVYDETVPNPTIENIEEALKIYIAKHCEAIIAFGGGSPMDCAKAVGARVARPNKTLSQLKGQLKVRKEIPPLFAVPTTAGTGSEATVAAVISNSKTHEKYAINDMSLIPHHAILDPLLTVNLPTHITSTTGMDALTHAVEAYIGKSNTAETEQCSREAVKLIFQNLEEAYNNGANLEARTNMQRAAYLAGIAFTRAYVGYVHAIAHTLGGFYSVPHGLANAIILPHVLEYYGDSVYERLADLADVVGVGHADDTNKRKAQQFIEAIKKLNEKMDIPNKVNGINESDLPLMIDRAYKEANPLYPVPKILSKGDLYSLYQIIKN
ncbi:Alcohol dehydrogenase, class IV [Mesobacillus persicus]|uniref:Alcohol dehydrogenase, class IV n=1 Tax=Mesobacillus persicus TaxID=930146 RepID=A0A1H7VR77_9BACI|nr:iron-containing alcohol dehydrogenase [Mesobacillus persicus]SEM11564.1 Alcohol dehydrogenase, class IV [Mesobacillus persicus]